MFNPDQRAFFFVDAPFTANRQTAAHARLLLARRYDQYFRKIGKGFGGCPQPRRFDSIIIGKQYQWFSDQNNTSTMLRTFHYSAPRAIWQKSSLILTWRYSLKVS
jgi:hypothetical protein